MKRIVIYIVLLVGFASCIDEMYRELKNIEPQLVVNGFFCQGEPFKVFVSKSYSPFFETQGECVTDARVTVFENGIAMGELTFQIEYDTSRIGPDSLNYYEKILTVDSFYTHPSLVPQVGKEYQIEVKLDGFKTARAKSTIPGLVPIKEVNKKLRYVDSYGYASETGIPYYEIVFDDPKERNYYLFSIYARNKRTIYADLRYKLPVPYISNDPVIGDYDNSTNLYDPIAFSFPDRLFNGKEYPLEVTIWEEYALNQAQLFDSLTVYLMLNNLSFDFEQYLKSVQMHETQRNNPLSEPISIYSNVTDGLGVFAGYACSKSPLLMRKKGKN